MASHTNIDGQDFRVAGHYALAVRRNAAAPTEVLAFANLPALALEVARRHRNETVWYSPGAWHTVQCAVSPNGKLLDLLVLLAFGHRLRAGVYAKKHFPGHIYRDGPVHGIRCFRASGGYARRYFRQMATMPERRLNALVVREDGELAARPKRAPSNIPNSWFDFSREIQRGWKSQHKGRKAWDRA